MLFPMAHNGDCLRQTDGVTLPQIGDPEVKIVHSRVLSVMGIFRQLSSRRPAGGRVVGASLRAALGAVKRRTDHRIRMQPRRGLAHTGVDPGETTRSGKEHCFSATTERLFRAAMLIVLIEIFMRFRGPQALNDN